MRNMHVMRFKKRAKDINYWKKVQIDSPRDASASSKIYIVIDASKRNMSGMHKTGRPLRCICEFELGIIDSILSAAYI